MYAEVKDALFSLSMKLYTLKYVVESRISATYHPCGKLVAWDHHTLKKRLFFLFLSSMY